MSYDYDFVVINWDDGVATIMKNGREYSYDLMRVPDLIEGALRNDVPIHEIGEKWGWL